MAGRGNLFSQDYPTNRYLVDFDLTQVLTGFGARRRAASAWLAEETCFLEITPPVIVLKSVCFPIQLLKRSGRNACILLIMNLLMI